MATEIVILFMILNSQQLVFLAKLSFPAISSRLVPTSVLPNPDVSLHLCSLGPSTGGERYPSPESEQGIILTAFPFSCALGRLQLRKHILKVSGRLFFNIN